MLCNIKNGGSSLEPKSSCVYANDYYYEKIETIYIGGKVLYDLNYNQYSGSEEDWYISIDNGATYLANKTKPTMPCQVTSALLVKFKGDNSHRYLKVVDVAYANE